MLCGLIFVWAALRCAFWAPSMDTGEWKEVRCWNCCVFTEMGFQHLRMLLGCLRRIMLGLAVCKCTGPACVSVGKPLRSRLNFIVKYLIWSDQMCFSAGWKFALNPLFFLMVSVLYTAVRKEICSSLKNVFTAVFSIVHLLFPHCLLKSKQCVNVSSPHDLLLLSVQCWWEEKVLGPFPARSRVDVQMTVWNHLGCCFLCPICMRLACGRPTLILCFVSVRLNLSFSHTVSWVLVYIFEQGESVWDFRV